MASISFVTCGCIDSNTLHCPYSPPNGKWGAPPPWLICIVPLTALYVYLHRAYATYAFAHHVMTATVSFIGRYSLHSISFGTLALPSNHSSNPYSCASSSAQLLLGSKSPVTHCSSSSRTYSSPTIRTRSLRGTWSCLTGHYVN